MKLLLLIFALQQTPTSVLLRFNARYDSVTRLYKEHRITGKQWQSIMKKYAKELDWKPKTIPRKK
jgi:hypothetical protein